MTTIIHDSGICPCGSGKTDTECCERFHSGEQLPVTAEQLMRSRFSGYARRNVNYLLASWEPSKRPATIDFSKETADWQSLHIINCKKGGTKDNKGIVEFKAFYSQDGVDCFIHEISRFVKNDNRWLYLDGVIKAAGKVECQVNAGRNALCGCGSGKKFKRCCGR